MNTQRGPRIVVSTCGTSILTNAARNLAGDQKARVTKRLQEGTNAVDRPSDPDVLRFVENLRHTLSGMTLMELAQASAEINGLACFYGRDAGLMARSSDAHYLVATDTGIGSLAADLVAGCLKALGLNVAGTIVPAGLRTDCLLSFRGGTAELFRQMADLCENVRMRGMPVVFQLSGGFKSMVGAMVAAGMVYADEICMLFENSDEMMVIPRLPFNLEQSAMTEMRNALPAIRRLGNDEELPVTECLGLSDVLYFEDDGRAVISEWGRILWDRARSALYPERVWPPSSDSVRFGPAFLPSVDRLTAEQRAGLNRAIDDLVRHMAFRSRGEVFNPASLRVHPVMSAQGWHEAYPGWDDARRLFFRYEGNPEVLVLDRLDDHL